MVGTLLVGALGFFTLANVGYLKFKNNTTTKKVKEKEKLKKEDKTTKKD